MKPKEFWIDEENDSCRSYCEPSFVHVIEYEAFEKQGQELAKCNQACEELRGSIKFHERERLRTEIERYKVTVERLENQLMAYEKRGWADE